MLYFRVWGDVYGKEVAVRCPEVFPLQIIIVPNNIMFFQSKGRYGLNGETI